MFVKTIKLY